MFTKILQYIFSFINLIKTFWNYLQKCNLKLFEDICLYSWTSDHNEF